jgi:hypothetical protein
MSWFRKDRGDRVDPDAVIAKAEASMKKVDDQQEHVNFINNWLVNRKDQNGLGEDFEWTLRPKGN